MKIPPFCPRFRVWAVALISAALLFKPGPSGAEEKAAPANFATENLVAWCIVPFDAAKRGPAERAEMLKRLGLKRLAYDWRAEHVAQFEEEIQAMQAAGIEFFAFWGGHDAAYPLFEKYGIHPQIWRTAPSPKGGTQEEKVAAAGQAFLPLVEKGRELGCKVGLYNHGGWGGEPENLVAVCEWLRANTEGGAEHVGIVYNFHHAHEHIDDFPAVLEKLKPYLLCLNLNGMNRDAQPMIVSIGQGEFEAQMIKAVVDSGYQGPIGILDHRNEMDAEQSLRENLEGLSGETIRQ